MTQVRTDYGETRESARREHAEKVGSLPGTSVQADLQNLDSRVTAAATVFTSTTAGIVPASGGGTTNFLRADATFSVPPTFTSGAAGYVPASGGGTTNFLRADGSWTASGGGSGRVLLNTITISSAVASVSDTTHFTTTYSRYQIIVEGLTAAATGLFRMTFYRSGTIYGGSAYTYSLVYVNSSSAVVGLGGTNDVSFVMSNSLTSGGSAYGIYELSCEDAAVLLRATFNDVTNSAGGSISGTNPFVTASNLTGVQITNSGGNLSGGTIRIYGLT